MRSEQAKKVAEEALVELMEDLDKGKSKKLIQYLGVMARFHNYSVRNQILISLQRPQATHVAGYGCWRNMGRQVKRGEKGIAILAPIMHRKTTDPDDETVVAFKTAYIFDINQTDGKPLPDFAKVQGDPTGCTDRLKGFIQKQGIILKYTSTLGGAEGVSYGDIIKVKKGLAPADDFSILVHELSHWLLHKNPNDCSPGRKVRETEAEAVAFVVCRAADLDTNTASSDYIQLYRGDRKTLVASLDRIQKTASSIIGAIMPQAEA
jgi:N-terminal domain of anti-restriction factor ArdC